MSFITLDADVINVIPGYKRTVLQYIHIIDEKRHIPIVMECEDNYHEHLKEFRNVIEKVTGFSSEEVDKINIVDKYH